MPVVMIFWSLLRHLDGGFFQGYVCEVSTSPGLCFLIEATYTVVTPKGFNVFKIDL
jgi:hypothetical protein